MLRNPNGLVLSHWHQLFEGFSTSTQEFYAAVEAAVRARDLPDIEISRVLHKEGSMFSANREYLRVSRRRVAFDICSAPYGGGHFFSWWLAKVPAKYGLLKVLGLAIALLPVWMVVQSVLLKMAPGPFGFFLSVFLMIFAIPMILLLLGAGVNSGAFGDEEWVLSVPWIGYLYAVVFNPVTYYREDTAMMFRDSVRSAVNEVINDLRSEKGLRLLGDEDLRPDASGVTAAT